MTPSRTMTMMVLLAACSGDAPDAAPTTAPPAVGVSGAEGTPEYVAHEDHPHVNQPPGWGKAVAPPPDAEAVEGAPSGEVDPYGNKPHEDVPHVTMPAGAGPDGHAQATPKPPPAEPITEPVEMPDVPPLVLQEGETLTIRGSAPGVERGQVRFTEKRGEEWVIVEVNVVVNGRFEVTAPANIPNPIYVSVGCDLLADGPTDDDLRGALAEPITVGAEDLELSVPMGKVPAWAKAQDPPIHKILDREAVLYAAMDR
ncbi:MAG: hypothetical protein H6741_35615 [Alphaproteobacteria bacterium]|nr:hypothetical protein [Alphaproteobacteria bacterium]MCB9798037.1 hypothetical protein [Alphaproteobacteria bacterium]